MRQQNESLQERQGNPERLGQQNEQLNTGNNEQLQREEVSLEQGLEEDRFGQGQQSEERGKMGQPDRGL
jgi:hypothetical protein